MRSWLLFCLLCLLPYVCAHEVLHNEDSSTEQVLGTIDLLNKGQYQEALDIKHQDAVMDDLIKWLYYKKQPGGKIDFVDLTDFIKRRSHWPEMRSLRLLAEKSSAQEEVSSVLGWFARNPPVSQHGRMSYANAQLSTNASCTTCLKHLKNAWISGHYSKSGEKEFLSRYGNRLHKTDHNKKIEYLLCNYKSGNYDVAHRISKLASSNYKYLIEAHKQARTRGQFTKSLDKNLPSHMKNHPCVLVEKIRWHTKSGNDKIAQNLLFTHTNLNKTSPNAEQLWKLKHIQIRHLIRDKQYDKAYQLTLNHGFSSGTNFAEATWLSGWIALRFLDDPQKAYRHFETLYKRVSFAASLSRGAYWAGRAADAMDNKALAKEWYNKAGKFVDTYYGQLALLYHSPDSAIQLPPVVKSLNKDIEKYQNNELVRAAYILLKSHKNKDAEKFLMLAVSKTKSPGERTLIAQLPYHLGDKSLGIVMAKRIGYHGFSLPHHISYPEVSDYKLESEDHLVNAIIRQESNFNEHIKSSAGAVGMMQLMPKTAEFTAKQIKVPYNKKKLVHKDYNIKLGDNYLRSLLEQTDDSYILSIASYNAGPNNVKNWIEHYGDPRHLNDLNDVVDWIEKVSFSETRTYIQRVLSNMQIYKAVIAHNQKRKDKNHPLPKIKDMYNDLLHKVHLRA